MVSQQDEQTQTPAGAAGNQASPASPIDAIKARMIEAQIVQVLRTTYDPEIPVNIYDLGLVYDIDVDRAGRVIIRMTLTSPSCPVAETLPLQVRESVGTVEGVKEVTIDLVWDPPWTPERMSEAARLDLGFM